MTNGNLPADAGTAEDTSRTFSQGVEDITGLLTDSDLPNPGEEDQVQEDGGAEDPDGVDDADDAANVDPVDEQDDDGPGDQSSGGKFVSGDAKFRLEDGTVISVSELARNNLYQRDYTRKTTEHKAREQQFEADRKTVDSFAQTLAQQRDFLIRTAKQFLPEPPDGSMLDPASDKYDPIGYSHQMSVHTQRKEALQNISVAQQQEMARQQHDAQRQAADARKRESDALMAAMPDLKTPANYQKFWTEAVETMAEYGLSEEDLNATVDHRFYLAMRDLIRYRKARAKVPQVKEAVQKKPLMSGGKRMDPKAKTSRDREARAQTLRKTGSFDAGVAALMDLDL